MIQSLERAFLILEILDDAGADGMGAQALARTVGLKFPTGHNFLKSLQQLGYVKQIEATGKYAIGEKSYNLGRKNDNKKILYETAHPVAEMLKSSFNESVTVAFYSNRTWYTLFRCNSTMDLVVNPNLPVSGNLYISGTGRCILSNLPEHELQKYVEKQGLPGNDWDGVNSYENLKNRLKNIQKNGHEIYDTNSGTIGVAFPIHVPARGIDAAIGIYMPESRFTGEHRGNIINGLREAAETICTICEN
jgi:DNA-binding IclR family transcriptional regulator